MEAEQEKRVANFGWALEKLWQGFKVARGGWHGKGMWLRYCRLDNHYWIDQAPEGMADLVQAQDRIKNGERPLLPVEPFIVIKTPGGQLYPWQPSTADMFAGDWEIVP